MNWWVPRAERSVVAGRIARMLPAAALVLVGCQEDRLPSEPEARPEVTAAVQLGAVGADDWIVVFEDGTEDPPGLARRLVAANGGSIRFTYEHALRGFSGTLPPQAVEAIGKNPNVAYVERDGEVRITAVGSWGLDRIDERARALQGVYDPGAGRDGSGVTAYILDTGIDFTLNAGEYEGRASSGYDFIDDDADASDCHGHGTHVAGTVGSKTYGVAKKVSLVSVRVLDCQGSGSYAGVIAGIDWVAAHKAAKSVANMSLGGGRSQSVNDAVDNAVAAGVVFAVSSGNSDADACNYSPASAPSAITVNASTSSDGRSYFSNYGTCTDIFAPGSAITSTTMGGGTASWSGTSMASPHVAGVAALVLQEGIAAANVPATIFARATPGVIADAGPGSPNRLLYAKTDSPCDAGCPSASVDGVSEITVTELGRKTTSGTVTVYVTDGTNPLEGVSVTGSWDVNGNPDFTSSFDTTGPDGLVTLSTGGIRFATTYAFCVTALDGLIQPWTGGEVCSPYPTGGGDPVTYTVGGTVSGLSGSGLVLRNNGGDDLAISGSGAFTFPTALADGSSYAVSVGTQPSGQTCSVSGGSGTIAGANVTDAAVTCANNTGGGDPAPTGLSATASQKGKTWKVDLSWSQGSSLVDISLTTGGGWTDVATGVSNTGSYTHNYGKQQPTGVSYRVCNAGSTSFCSEGAVTF